MKRSYVLAFVSVLLLLSGVSASIKTVTAVNTVATDELIKSQTKSLKSLIRSSYSDFQINTLVTTSERRKQMMLEMAHSSPNIFLANTFDSESKSKLPFSVQKNIEKEISASGSLLNLYKDDFEKPENSGVSHIFKNNLKEYQLYTQSPFEFTSGTALSLKGYELDNSIVAENENISYLNSGVKENTLGNQRLLVFLIKFKNSPSPPFTVDQANERIFNGSIQRYYKEQSYNRMYFSGKTFGWIELPINDPAALPSDISIDGKRILTVDSDLMQDIISENNIKLSDYDRILYLVHTSRRGGVSTLGSSPHEVNGSTYTLSESYVGVGDYSFSSKYSFPFSWNNLENTTAHELGHAMGLKHAGAYDCGSVTYKEDCLIKDTGNLYDAMGYYTIAQHFNAFGKKLLGWLLPSEILTINKSGVYSLGPFELASSKYKAAEIIGFPGATLPLMLEWRTANGFDAKLGEPRYIGNTKGLMANRYVGTLGLRVPSPVLLDLRPTSKEFESDIENVVLSPGDSFYDESTDMTIRNISGVLSKNIHSNIQEDFSTKQAEEYGKFEINMDTYKCFPSEPTISLQNQVQAIAGYEKSINIQLLNNNKAGCSPVHFDPIIEKPKTWSYFLSHELFSDNKSRSWGMLTFKIPSDTKPGLYSAKFQVKQRETGHISKPILLTLDVVKEPLINNVNPIQGPIGSYVHINGENLLAGNMHMMLNISSIDHKEYYSKPVDLSSKSSNQLTFIFPETLPIDIISFREEKPKPGRYNVELSLDEYVINNFIFTVTDSSIIEPTPSLIPSSSPSPSSSFSPSPKPSIKPLQKMEKVSQTHVLFAQILSTLINFKELLTSFLK